MRLDVDPFPVDVINFEEKKVLMRIDQAESTVIPCSEIAETKPPYVCPGCFIHTYSNNMINKFSCSIIQLLVITE
jgi:hypothetical protein